MWQLILHFLIITQVKHLTFSFWKGITTIRLRRNQCFIDNWVHSLPLRVPSLLLRLTSIMVYLHLLLTVLISCSLLRSSQSLILLIQEMHLLLFPCLSSIFPSIMYCSILYLSWWNVLKLWKPASLNNCLYFFLFSYLMKHVFILYSYQSMECNKISSVCLYFKSIYSIEHPLLKIQTYHPYRMNDHMWYLEHPQSQRFIKMLCNILTS